MIRTCELLFALDADYTIQSYFTQDESKLLMPPAKFIGQPFHAILPEQVSASLMIKFEECIQLKESVLCEYQLELGEINRDFCCEVVPGFDSSGAIQQFVVIISDITEELEEKKMFTELERRYQLIFDKSKAGIVFGKDWKVVDCNEAYSTIMEMSKEELMVTPMSTFTHPDDREIELESWKKLMSSENDSYRLEKRYVTGKGNIKWVDAIVSVVHSGKENEPPYFFGIVNEISESIELRNQLSSHNETMLQLFSVIGHDLRNPLGNIRNLSELLNETIDDEESRKLNGLINSTSAKTLDLLQHLLDWGTAHLEHKLNLSEIDSLEKLVRNVVSQLEPIANSKQIRLNLKQKSDYTAKLDQRMIETILRNIISNSIKFSHPSSFIDIEVFKESENLCFEIKDYGIGMSEKDIESLFNLKSSNTKAGTNNEKGFGFGLLICSEFVKLHKGQIKVQSTPGEGSCFQVIIPQSA